MKNVALKLKLIIKLQLVVVDDIPLVGNRIHVVIH